MSDLDFETKTQAYHYDLPEKLIAQQPREDRASSRLLVIHRKESRWEHRQFAELPGLLNPIHMIVANNSKVLKARLLGHRLRQENDSWVVGGKVEFVMLEQIRPRVWEGLFHASAKYVAGLKFQIPTPSGKPLQAELIQGSAESPTGTVVAEFDRDPVESGAGELPLPHYIQRSDLQRAPGSDTRLNDEAHYQTIYSKVIGSAAAPTAGLHFNQKILDEIRAKGIPWEEVTLNVGLGTFRPVKTEDLRSHTMHAESYEISPEVAQRIQSWKTEGRKIIAVGTTSVRTLESAWDSKIQGLRPGVQKTALFIRPGAFKFQVVDHLLTNFHLPQSTLLMLVSAFAGRELVMDAYREAVKEEYRFFSYGDAMLIL